MYVYMYEHIGMYAFMSTSAPPPRPKHVMSFCPTRSLHELHAASISCFASSIIFWTSCGEKSYIAWRPLKCVSTRNHEAGKVDFKLQSCRSGLQPQGPKVKTELECLRTRGAISQFIGACQRGHVIVELTRARGRTCKRIHIYIYIYASVRVCPTSVRAHSTKK